MIAFFLGRQPELGMAELQAVFGRTPILVNRTVATLDIPQDEVLAQTSRLGSVIKAGEIVADNFVLNKTNLEELVKANLASIDGKITLGVSIYSDQATKKSAVSLSYNIRNVLKQSGHSVRLLPTTDTTLSTATVLHNGLASNNPKKVELSFTKTKQGMLVARTIFIQDIDDYTKRDRLRPCRDARNGMLPPKLAQTMINLAIGASSLVKQPYNVTEALTKSGLKPRPQNPLRLLDPFCGTGVVLIEASLMGKDTIKM